MPSGLLTALGGGAVSALFFLSILTGSLSALILAYLAPLPLFLVGLSSGLIGTMVAAGVAALVIAAFGGILAALPYLVAHAVPVTMVVRQALLARPRPDGGTEWYPPGLMILWLTGLGIAAVVAAAIFAAGNEGGLQASVQTLLTNAFDGMFPEADGTGPDGADGQGVAGGAAAAALAPVFPGIVVISWLVMTVINAALAQGLLMRFGRNLRPPMRVADVELPGWAAIVLATIGLAALVLPGPVGYVALNASLVLVVPFFFAGLAVVHAFMANRGSRTLGLVLFYLVLFAFGWPAFVVIGLGVIEQWAGFRRRLADAGPDRERNE